MGQEEDNDRAYRIGRGEIKYEVSEILKKTREEADPELKELANKLLDAVELEIQKL